MFIEEELEALRRDRFRPRAAIRYARSVARRVREDVEALPGAVRSVWSVALGFFALAFVGAAVVALAYDRRLAYDLFLSTSLLILPLFALITVYIGTLKDRNGYRLSALNVPIVLTLLRVALIPAVALFLLRRHDDLAFGVFLLAAVTDVADGWVARRWNQVTRFGTVLDPIVDIVFNLALFGSLCAAHLIHPWVFAVAALRYAILLFGGAGLYVFVGPVRIHPTLFGRLTGIVNSALIALLMLLETIDGSLGATLAPLTEIALGVLSCATVLQVLALGWYNLRLMTGKAEARGRVVGDVRWDAS